MANLRRYFELAHDNDPVRAEYPLHNYKLFIELNQPYIKDNPLKLRLIITEDAVLVK